MSAGDELYAALARAGTVLDETDTEYVIEAVLPVVVAHGVSEYERGLEAGGFFARQEIARTLGLGTLAGGAS